jgi:hypothetical protein
MSTGLSEIEETSVQVWVLVIYFLVVVDDVLSCCQSSCSLLSVLCYVKYQSRCAFRASQYPKVQSPSWEVADDYFTNASSSLPCFNH